MTGVQLLYGRAGLEVTVPSWATVIAPIDLPAVADEQAAVEASLARPMAGPPLAEIIEPGRPTVVVFPDITRPMPNRTVLPPLLAALERLGCGPREVTLLCATGTHRPATRSEHVELLGEDLVRRYRVRDHAAAADAAHVEVGQEDGAPVLIDREYVEAANRVVTGFVEPHFFAGFSGGRKGVCPGIAGLPTILEAHSPRRIADERATWAVLGDNPVDAFVTAAAALAPPSFSVDVTINRARRLTGVFSGALPESHRLACAFVEQTAIRRVPEPFDIVVTTNAGFPLDRNLYQAVKGMAAAERIVRPGGTIIVAAECADGMPDEGEFARVLASSQSPAQLMSTDVAPSLDRWQAQVLGRVCLKAEVVLVSDGLTAAQARTAHLGFAPSVEAALAAARARLGDAASVAVLPEGPLTVATVDSRIPERP